MFSIAGVLALRLVPVAVMLLILPSATGAPAFAGSSSVDQAPLPFDLVGAATDQNGLPVNPIWTWQQTNPAGLADPAICGGKAWKEPCTSQTPTINDSWRCTGIGPLGGHANWMPATFTGTVFWNSHSSPATDDDYNIDLYRSDNAGLTAGSERARALNGAPVLHMEFDSDETIDHFGSPWWDTFHNAVDDGDASARAMLDGRLAIAIGLFGLDYAHSGGAELHPVYGLAVQTNPSKDDDTWAIFARNWGTQGYCGDGNEHLNATQMTFLVPRINAADAQVVSRHIYFGPNDMSAADKSAVSGPTVSVVPGVGALVTFTLPGPRSGARINGILHLKWTTRVPPGITTRPAWLTETAIDRRTIIAREAVRRRRAGSMGSDIVQSSNVEPEARQAAVFDALSASQRRVFRQLVSRPAPTRDAGRTAGRRGAVVDVLPVGPARPTVTRVADAARDSLNRRRGQPSRERRLRGGSEDVFKPTLHHARRAARRDVRSIVSPAQTRWWPRRR